MQDAAAAIIYKSLDGVGSSYSDTVVCDLLEIAETEMGYKASEDPLSDRILWLAVQRLEKLQKSGRFVSLLQEHQELAMHLCMRAGSKSWNNRRKSYAGRAGRQDLFMVLLEHLGNPIFNKQDVAQRKPHPSKQWWMTGV
ncbi:hypothetical protein I7I51_09015 [Histoplasma capsulatum]|uniref:Uncharacterized protein n=1 Tax=Ajellomyces capsulatus TaxID=5037 RepID=A0A8A1M0I5_AJECA|nr:predicted protein [Histoplasma mississippiense (nom. inval.)]EDN05428.1 predicted protein [Histoplasma mississippiense (nom. inval.)]QSS59579.1 hypothetical protein I7I51_09015 [Histoplasma capsulatum]